MIDLLTTLIAFAVVLLLLSVLVTALAHFTQATLRLRGRNLLNGLKRLLAAAPKDALPDDADAAARRIARGNARWQPSSGTPSLEETLGKRVKLAVAGPTRRWITPEELEAELPGAKPTADEDKKPTTQGTERLAKWRADVVRNFDAFEGELGARFARMMKIVAFVWAFAIAFYFQVSTPDLLFRLSTDRELRDRYAAAAESALAIPPAPEVPGGDDTRAAQGALQELARRHPDLANVLEEASGGDGSVADAGEELRLVLAGQERPVADARVAEYRELVTEQRQAQVERRADEIRAASASLARIDVRPWPRGWNFYRDAGRTRFDRLFGVLLTAVLLTLGAPFWYDRLKDFVGLRDLLAPRKPDATKTPSDKADSQSTLKPPPAKTGGGS